MTNSTKKLSILRDESFAESAREIGQCKNATFSRLSSINMCNFRIDPNVELEICISGWHKFSISVLFIYISASLTLLERFMQIANCQNSSAFTPCFWSTLDSIACTFFDVPNLIQSAVSPHQDFE